MFSTPVERFPIQLSLLWYKLVARAWLSAFVPGKRVPAQRYRRRTSLGSSDLRSSKATFLSPMPKACLLLTSLEIKVLIVRLESGSLILILILITNRGLPLFAFSSLPLSKILSSQPKEMTHHYLP